jgi:hypothetical protein
MKYEEVALIKERSELIDDLSFLIRTSGNLGHKDDMIQDVSVYGIMQSFSYLL